MTANVNSYDGLVIAIAQWINRNDTTFIQNIPLFISLAEQDFFYECSTLGNEKYITGSFNANSGIVPRPSMWGQTLTFSFLDSSNNVHVLERVPYEYIRTFIPNNTTSAPEYTTYSGSVQTILPIYYTDYGYDYFLISPTPTVAYNYEIAYYEKIQPLSLTNQTNWITQYAYDTFFYLCLNKAYLYVHNSVDAETFRTKAKDQMADLKKYSDDRQFDRTVNATKG